MQGSILVVDDDADTATLVRDALTKRGYDARAVHIAPGIDRAVAVGVVLQENKLSGDFVVLRADTFPRFVSPSVACGRD